MNDVARRASRSTLTAQVEQALRLDIIEGVLKPGQRLRTSELAMRYNVSATPLREALQRLSAENLIVLDPRFGASVSQISTVDLHDIYWMRSILETLALQRSIERAGASWEDHLKLTWGEFRRVANGDRAAQDPLVWSDAHRAFHEALLQQCGSPWLGRILRMLYDHSERYRMVSITQTSRDPLAEHQRIFAAALARDVASATQALHTHLETTVVTLEHLARSPVSDSED